MLGRTSRSIHLIDIAFQHQPTNNDIFHKTKLSGFWKFHTIQAPFELKRYNEIDYSKIAEKPFLSSFLTIFPWQQWTIISLVILTEVSAGGRLLIHINVYITELFCLALKWYSMEIEFQEIRNIELLTWNCIGIDRYYYLHVAGLRKHKSCSWSGFDTNSTSQNIVIGFYWILKAWQVSSFSRKPSWWDTKSWPRVY